MGGEQMLDPTAKKVQGEHVEQQVHAVGVDEPVTQQAFILALAFDCRWPQDQAVKQTAIRKRAPGNQDGNADQ